MTSIWSSVSHLKQLLCTNCVPSTLSLCLQKSLGKVDTIITLFYKWGQWGLMDRWGQFAQVSFLANVFLNCHAPPAWPLFGTLQFKKVGNFSGKLEEFQRFHKGGDWEKEGRGGGEKGRCGGGVKLDWFYHPGFISGFCNGSLGFLCCSSKTWQRRERDPGLRPEELCPALPVPHSTLVDPYVLWGLILLPVKWAWPVALTKDQIAWELC